MEPLQIYPKNQPSLLVHPLKDENLLRLIFGFVHQPTEMARLMLVSRKWRRIGSFHFNRAKLKALIKIFEFLEAKFSTLFSDEQRFMKEEAKKTLSSPARLESMKAATLAYDPSLSCIGNLFQSIRTHFVKNNEQPNYLMGLQHALNSLYSNRNLYALTDRMMGLHGFIPSNHPIERFGEMCAIRILLVAWQRFGFSIAQVKNLFFLPFQSQMTEFQFRCKCVLWNYLPIPTFTFQGKIEVPGMAFLNDRLKRSRLTHLTFSNTAGRLTEWGTAVLALKEALCKMPFLEGLTFDHCIPQVDDDVAQLLADVIFYRSTPQHKVVPLESIEVRSCMFTRNGVQKIFEIVDRLPCRPSIIILYRQRDYNRLMSFGLHPGSKCLIKL